MRLKKINKTENNKIKNSFELYKHDGSCDTIFTQNKKKNFKN